MLANEDNIYRQLRSALENLVSLDETEWDLIRKSFIPLTAASKTVIVNAGKIAENVYFLSQGMARLYYQTRDNDQITAFLFTENMFGGCLESFLKQEPGTQYFEALEDSVFLSISKANLDRLYELVPKTNIVMRKLMEARFISSQRLLASYLLASPQERYEQFSRNHPDLVQRVPQYILASFLGVTPVSLSRIRKRMTQQP